MSKNADVRTFELEGVKMTSETLEILREMIQRDDPQESAFRLALAGLELAGTMHRNDDGPDASFFYDLQLTAQLYRSLAKAKGGK